MPLANGSTQPLGVPRAFVPPIHRRPAYGGSDARLSTDTSSSLPPMRKLAVPLAVALLLFAGCGDSSDSESGTAAQVAAQAQDDDAAATPTVTADSSRTAFDRAVLSSPEASARYVWSSIVDGDFAAFLALLRSHPFCSVR